MPLRAGLRMLLRLVLLLAIVPAAQGGTITPERQLTDLQVRVTLLEPDRLVDTCHGLGAWGNTPKHVVAAAMRGSGWVGCSAFNEDTGHCVVYAVRPRHVDDRTAMAVLGHEILHCMWGRWHE